MEDKKTDTQDRAKEAVTKLSMLAFRDGYETALIQLETYLIQTYANKVHGISNPEEIVALDEEKMTKLLDTKVALGTFLTAMTKTREAVTGIMQAKAKTKAPEKESGQLDGGIILQ